MADPDEGTPDAVPTDDVPDDDAAVDPDGGVRAWLRTWRRTRPFWAGLWCLLGGGIIAGIPLSDVETFIVTGSSGTQAVLPGIVLVVAGLFLWFSPPNRMLAGVLAITFAVASLILSNLGGLLIGMLLGILGGAMALAWTDRPRPPRRRRRPIQHHPNLVLLVGGLVLGLSVAHSAAEASLLRDAGSCASERTLLGLVVCVNDTTTGAADVLADDASDLVDDVVGTVDDLLLDPVRDLLQDLPDLLEVPDALAPRAPADDPAPATGPSEVRPAATSHGTGHVAPLQAGDLFLDTLRTSQLRYLGRVAVPTATGTTQVMRFEIAAIEATGLQLDLPPLVSDRLLRILGRDDTRAVVGNTVILDCSRLALEITGANPPLVPLPQLPVPLGIPLEFSVDDPADDLLLTLLLGAVPLDLDAVNVEIDLVTLSADTLFLPAGDIQRPESGGPR